METKGDRREKKRKTKLKKWIKHNYGERQQFFRQVQKVKINIIDKRKK